MVLQIIVQKLKSLLLLIVGVFRRALCCFRRKRLNSEDCIPLTTIGVVPNKQNNGYEADNWNNWEDRPENQKPNSIQQHIEMYRQQTLLARQKSVEKQSDEKVEAENFFEDMTPRITKQQKIFLNSGESNETNGSRLNFNPQGIITPGNELGEWEENTGWEEQTQSDLNPQDIIREKRRQERERRLWEQQQKKQEKYNRPLGAKIS